MSAGTDTFALFPGVHTVSHKSSDPEVLREILAGNLDNLTVYVWASIYPEYPTDGYWVEMSQRGIRGLRQSLMTTATRRIRPVADVPFTSHTTSAGKITVWIGVDWEQYEGQG